MLASKVYDFILNALELNSHSTPNPDFSPFADLKLRSTVRLSFGEGVITDEVIMKLVEQKQAFVIKFDDRLGMPSKHYVRICSETQNRTLRPQLNVPDLLKADLVVVLVPRALDDFSYSMYELATVLSENPVENRTLLILNCPRG